jgi:hypothetical protein
MFIGHRVPIGTFMAMGCLCRIDALAPLIASVRAVWLTLTDYQPGRIGEGVIRHSRSIKRRVTPSACNPSYALTLESRCIVCPAEQQLSALPLQFF